MVGTRFYAMAATTLLMLAGAFLLMMQGILPGETTSLTIAQASVTTPKKYAGKNPANEIKTAFIASENQQDDLVQQKYAILFSALQLSAQTREQLQHFLRERETIAGRSFYDTHTNSAEVAENLPQRELDLAKKIPS